VKVNGKLVLGATAFVLTLTAVGVAPAGAAGIAKVNEIGVITCGQITGSITYNPPLTNSGTAPETSIVRLLIPQCVNAGGATVIPTQGRVRVKMVAPAGVDSCSSLLPTPDTLTIRWRPGRISRSTSTYSGYDAVTDPSSAVTPK
jgi:hypothetical protein